MVVRSRPFFILKEDLNPAVFRLKTNDLV
jgi:hypothetical protein